VIHAIVMPNLGAIAEEATIVGWLVAEGDHVEVGQPIFEVETDKATVEVESVRAGRIVRLLAGDGETVTVGTTIAEIETQDT
jgi:pyruvate dehydrogenase E2 component (dihydrolipoyllysine-residue acetyltransferase)